MAEEERTWAPSPGDALAPPPTPPAPEIPINKTWPWVAGAALVLRYLVLLAVLVVLVVLVIHWI